VQSSDPVARTYAVDEAEIGGAEALSAGPVIEGLSLDPSGGTALGRSANGDIIYLSRFENNVLLANYWSSTCDPCWRRMLEVQQLYDDYQSYGLAVVNVNFGDTIESANTYIDAKGRKITMMRLTDPAGQASGGLGVAGLPTTILFDGNGREVMRYGETSHADKIRQDLDLLLK
jgi:peroxiredoxin